MNRHATRSARETAAVTRACSAGNCVHVQAVSNVSDRTPIESSADGRYGASKNAWRHAPAAPLRPPVFVASSDSLGPETTSPP